jgi:hypothetical protein
MHFKIHFIFSQSLYLFPYVIMLSLFVSCTKKQPTLEVKTTRLKKFNTIINSNSYTLAVPEVVKYYQSHLFIYDKGKNEVLELDMQGNIISSFGRTGKGPGEFIRVRNIFLVQNNLYILDSSQYRILKYNLGGTFLSMMNYGSIMAFGSPNLPPAPFSPDLVRAEDIKNQPVVTLNGNVLLSSIRFGDTTKTVYELSNWKGKYLSGIGRVPKGSRFIVDQKKLRKDVNRNIIPGYYRSHAFPVVDRSKPGTYFLVFTAYPKIVKYNSTGKKLWGTQVIKTAAIDSIKNHFFVWMKRNSDFRIALNYYLSGVCGPDGNLYLIMDTKPIIIHQFNAKGRLIHIYKLISKKIQLTPIFAIDFQKHRIFIVTKLGGIRTYPF